MSDTALDDLKKIRAAFAEDRRANIKEAISLLPANRHAAFQEAREALDLQAEIEALDRAISDEESLADRPKRGRMTLAPPQSDLIIVSAAVATAIWLVLAGFSRDLG